MLSRGIREISSTASVNQINLHKIPDTTSWLATTSPITIPTLMKTRSTSQDRNCPHMSSKMTLQASDSFLIAMHQVCSAGESGEISSTASVNQINLHKISGTTSWLATASPITIPTLIKTHSTSQDTNVPHMSSTMTLKDLKASDSFLIAMHQVCSAGESEKSLQRPVLIKSTYTRFRARLAD